MARGLEKDKTAGRSRRIPKRAGAPVGKPTTYTAPPVGPDGILDGPTDPREQVLPFTLVKKLPSREESLAHVDKSLAKQWHPRLNGPVTPETVFAGSRVRHWWVCADHPDEHVWAAPVGMRVRQQTRCPYCHGSLRVDPKKSLAAVHADDLMQEWAWELNAEHDPWFIGPRSPKRASWKCRTCAEVWTAKVQDRTSGFNSCPSCKKKQLMQQDSLQARFPDIAAEWHPTRNEQKADQVFAKTATPAWWQCSACQHEWQTAVENRTRRGSGCPECYRAGLKGRGRGNVLRTENPALFAELVDQKAYYDITYGSKQAVEWCCRECAHTWTDAPGNRHRGNGCPACAGSVATKQTNLKKLYPRLAKEWHPGKNVDLRPEQIVPTYGQQVWWKCSQNHEWEDSPQNRVATQRVQQNLDILCPYCAGDRPSPDYNFARNFEDLAEQWHPDNELDAHAYKPYSNKVVKWLCPEGHSWEMPISHRTVNRQNCPECARLVSDPNESLAALHPALAKQWHRTLNGERTPLNTAPGYGTDVWWQCQAGHTWLVAPAIRTRGDSGGCPICDKSYSWGPARLRSWISAHLEILETSNRKQRENLLEEYGLLRTSSIARTMAEYLRQPRLDVNDLREWMHGNESVAGDLLAEHDPRAYGSRKAVPKSVRDAVLKRDGHTCQNPYCPTDHELALELGLHCDHIKPWSKGGSNEMDNLQALCMPCNVRRGNKDWEEFKAAEAKRT